MTVDLPAPEESLHLWFDPPERAQTGRRVTLTRERVVAEALTLIAADGVDALSMRSLAAALGVVPGALYRHVRSKEQLHDLVLDAVLAEVDCSVDDRWPWREQVGVLAGRLRTVLEDHPGMAGLLKTRAPLTPHSLALAEAMLAPLRGARLPDDQTARAYHLVYDYVLGFALGDSTCAAEQRVQDGGSRQLLRAFLRSLPNDRFPALATLGELVWVDGRDERFTANLGTILDGLSTANDVHSSVSRAEDTRSRSRDGHGVASSWPSSS